MKRRLNRKKKLSPKNVDFAAWHDQQGAYNNSVRELETLDFGVIQGYLEWSKFYGRCMKYAMTIVYR